MFSIEITPSQPVNWLQFGIIGLVHLLFGWFVWSARGKNSPDGQQTAFAVFDTKTQTRDLPTSMEQIKPASFLQ